jgi:hypothetical protein
MPGTAIPEGDIPMLHRNRHWTIAPAESAEQLAEQLTQHTWCGCNGFSLGGYLFVNDATSADAAQEYAALRESDGQYVQIESLTFSWMDQTKALDIIRRVLAGEFDHERYDVVDSRRIQSPAEHGRCHHCM